MNIKILRDAQISKLHKRVDKIDDYTKELLHYVHGYWNVDQVHQLENNTLSKIEILDNRIDSLLSRVFELEKKHEIKKNKAKK